MMQPYRFVGHQLEVVGLAADDAAQRDQRVVLVALGHGLQGHGHFECAGHQHVLDVLFLHAQGQQLCAAGGGQGVGDALVETGLHDADVQLLAVQFVCGAFVCAKHSDPVPVFILWG